MILKKYICTIMGFYLCATLTWANSQDAIPTKDTDYDGLSDQQEERLGTDPWLSDTDGDGVKDAVEVGDNVDKPLDTDNDRRIDALDVDDDGDGVPTILEGQQDTDGDGVMNYLDLDSDGDDQPDRLEAGIAGKDTDNDGLDDYFDVDQSGGEDQNGDGVDGQQPLPDKDADGIPDIHDVDDQSGQGAEASDPDPDAGGVEDSDDKSLDADPEQVDSDDDKAQDDSGNVKARDDSRDNLNRSQGAVLEGNPEDRDTDQDGINDALEIGLDPATPMDTDGDGLADFRDEDDDGDGILTRIEGEEDRDGDGRVNYLDVDPGGYFYCAGNGRIVKGVRKFKVLPKKSVEIINDARNGIFSWRISQPGTYSLSFVLPKGLSVLPKSDNGQLYVTSFNGDLVSLGRSEDIAREGYLADFDPKDLPAWYNAFAIQEGAPPIVNMNIPLVGERCEK